MSRALELFLEIERGGTDFIDQLVANAEPEDLYLDYKRSADHGINSKLHQDDRNNLSRAISGFGNSEGGVVIWGVDCRFDPIIGDVPQKIYPIAMPQRFRSWLESSVSGATIPPHDSVRHIALQYNDRNEGFVVSMIPRGNQLPYQTSKDSRYLMRAGSAFAAVPHSVLAGMFGRSPQSQVFPVYLMSKGKFDGSLHFTVIVTLRNGGQGVASDAFLNVSVSGGISKQSDIEFEQGEPNRFNSTFHLGRMWTSILNPDLRLAPEALASPLILRFIVSPPFEKDIEIDIMTGSSNSVPYRSKWKMNVDEIATYFKKIVDSSGRDEDIKEFVERLIKNSK